MCNPENHKDPNLLVGGLNSDRLTDGWRRWWHETILYLTYQSADSPPPDRRSEIELDTDTGIFPLRPAPHHTPAESLGSARLIDEQIQLHCGVLLHGSVGKDESTSPAEIPGTADEALSVGQDICSKIDGDSPSWFSQTIENPLAKIYQELHPAALCRAEAYSDSRRKGSTPFGWKTTPLYLPADQQSFRDARKREFQRDLLGDLECLSCRDE